MSPQVVARPVEMVGTDADRDPQRNLRFQKAVEFANVNISVRGTIVREQGAPLSDKPVAERLQVKGDRRLAVIGASAALDKTVGASKARADVAKADVVLLFAPDRARLDADLPGLLKRMAPRAILWVAYPKMSSRLAADLSRDIIHALAPKHGLDTVSQIAIDADWSALRLKRLGPA
jgi:hypothetical protein